MDYAFVVANVGRVPCENTMGELLDLDVCIGVPTRPSANKPRAAASGLPAHKPFYNQKASQKRSLPLPLSRLSNGDLR